MHVLDDVTHPRSVNGEPPQGDRRVSIVIPCHNQGRFAREAIDSVLRQSHSAHEIVLVDDGSTDETREIPSEFPSVRYVRQTQQGVSSARNAGMSTSTGTFVVFLDADDRLLPDALAVGLCALLDRPSCALASGWVTLISADGAPLGVPGQELVERDHYRLLLRGNYVWTPGAVMYRRSALEAVGGFNLARAGAEDYDLNLRIARAFPIHCHSQVLLEHRVHVASMSRKSARMLEDAVTALKDQAPFVKGNPDWHIALLAGLKEMRRGYGQPLMTEVCAQLRAGDWRRALRGMWTLARYDPGGPFKALGRRLARD
jgi:glycosyltransferase involved in cell wall biosynthesis